MLLLTFPVVLLLNTWKPFVWSFRWNWVWYSTFIDKLSENCTWRRYFSFMFLFLFQSLNLNNHCDNGPTQRTQNRSAQTPQSPHTPAGLPPNFRQKITPQTPPQTPESPLNGYPDDDLDSVFSYTSMASGRSMMSTCDHPYVSLLCSRTCVITVFWD